MKMTIKAAQMTKKNLIIAGFILIVIFYLPVLFVSQETLSALLHEDSFYESVTAWFFFFASIVFLYNFFTAKKKNIFFLLFALAFFFAAGEEISWGQRILGFKPPEWFVENNAQEEFNIHNLAPIQHENSSQGLVSSIKSLLNFNRFFILFWFVYCIIIPLANQYSPKLRQLFSTIRLPVISVWFGVLFLLNEIICQALGILVISRDPLQPPIAELKESLWGLLSLFMGIYFLLPMLSRIGEKRNYAGTSANNG